MTDKRPDEIAAEMEPARAMDYALKTIVSLSMDKFKEEMKVELNAKFKSQQEELKKWHSESRESAKKVVEDDILKRKKDVINYVKDELGKVSITTGLSALDDTLSKPLVFFEKSIKKVISDLTADKKIKDNIYKKLSRKLEKIFWRAI